LFVASGLALLPYGWALLVWTALLLPAYLMTIRSILPRPETVLVALAFPAVFVNMIHGQNGFLTAALLGGALVLLNERPIVAGMLLGFLTYKPQFGLLIPVVLLATRRWSVVGAATVTALCAGAASLAVFGVEAWRAFAHSTTFSRVVVLEAGNTGWAKIQSAFSAVRMWGGSIEIAYATQIALTLAIAATLIWLWRSRVSYDLKAAALACGCLLATPYILDYDLVVLAVSIAFFTRHAVARGFLDYEISTLVLAWTAPLVSRSAADATGLPIGLIAMLALYALTLRRAAIDLSADEPMVRRIVHV
jgi:hypothetical protein